jgi:hypothetical protein
MRLRRYDEALGAHDRFLAVDPSSVKDWLGRGSARWELAPYDEALAASYRATALGPNTQATQQCELVMLRPAGRA